MRVVIDRGIIAQTVTYLVVCCILEKIVITYFLLEGHYTFVFTYGGGLGLKPVYLM